MTTNRPGPDRDHLERMWQARRDQAKRARHEKWAEEMRESGWTCTPPETKG